MKSKKNKNKKVAEPSFTLVQLKKIIGDINDKFFIDYAREVSQVKSVKKLLRMYRSHVKTASRKSKKIEKKLFKGSPKMLKFKPASKGATATKKAA